MPRWREHLFVVLNRGAASAVALLPAASPAGVRGRHAGRDLNGRRPTSECGEAGVVEVWAAVGAEVDLALEGGDDGVGEVDAVQLLA